MIAGIMHDWCRAWSLPSRMIAGRVCNCWHHAWLAASRAIGIMCDCWHCWHCSQLLALYVVTGIIHGHWLHVRLSAWSRGIVVAGIVRDCWHRVGLPISCVIVGFMRCYRYHSLLLALCVIIGLVCGWRHRELFH